MNLVDGDVTMTNVDLRITKRLQSRPSHATPSAYPGIPSAGRVQARRRRQGRLVFLLVLVVLVVLVLTRDQQGAGLW